MHKTSDKMNPTVRKRAYINLAEVEFRQEGQAAQKQEAACVVIQQARLPSPKHILYWISVNIQKDDEISW